MFNKLMTKTALKVILTLVIGTFIAIKSPEGVQIACAVAEVLEVSVDACK